MFELRSVEKSFPGVHALKGVDMQVDKSEIVGLVGENGAGKSTLMKIIYGAYQHDKGQLLVHGREQKFASPIDAMRQGVGMVFQEQSLIPNISVMENIYLGVEHHFTRAGFINYRSLADATRAQLEKVQLDVNPAAVTSSLSFAQRQLVELAKVLTLEERVESDLVILLDEPTSVLSAEEIELLFSIVRGLLNRASFIFVSHRLDEVISLSDRLYVLKDGEMVGHFVSDQADVESIQQKMVGREVSREYYREQRQKPYDHNNTALELDRLGREGAFQDVSFSLHAGEVLALVGTEGSGREAVMRSIFGLDCATEGEIRIHGKQYHRPTPRQSVALGLGYVPRERKTEGILAGLNVYENMTLSQLEKYHKSGFLKIAQERALASEWIDTLAIKVPSVDADCGNLSGGNQQKVVIAKWRSGNSTIVLLDHPTRGLDVGAKEDVYELVRDMSEAGVAILLVADTLEEAIGLSHTIVVIRDGRVRQRFDAEGQNKPTPYDLVQHMI